MKNQITTLNKVIESAINFIQSIEIKQWGVKFSANDEESENELAKSLLKMRANLVELSKREEERNWVSEGIAKFSDILRSNTSIDILAEDITRNLIPYLKANQGALFILNDDDPKNHYLEMKGLYAYGKKKYFNKVINPGEGLVGQCYLEGEMTYISDVPADYVKITSGLGEATPRFVVLTPLKLHEKTAGVLELVSFQPIQKHQIELINKVSEAIAGTILNAKVAEHTSKLLNDSDVMTKQLRNQEEIMKLNLEKITVTQEELQKQNEELELAKKEIEKQQLDIELIQKREMELIESKLQTQQMIHSTIVSKLKEKIAELQEQLSQIEKIETHLN